MVRFTGDIFSRVSNSRRINTNYYVLIVIGLKDLQITKNKHMSGANKVIQSALEGGSEEALIKALENANEVAAKEEDKKK